MEQKIKEIRVFNDFANAEEDVLAIGEDDKLYVWNLDKGCWELWKNES